MTYFLRTVEVALDGKEMLHRWDIEAWPDILDRCESTVEVRQLLLVQHGQHEPLALYDKDSVILWEREE